MKYDTHSDFFDLTYMVKKRATIVDMKVVEKFVRTNKMPKTSAFLKKHFPQVLETRCFNQAGLSFQQEIKDTELGHLFEHILLVYLCQMRQLLKEDEDCSYSGVTSWNWEKDPRGTFAILIEINEEEQDIFYFALEKTCKLLNTLCTVHEMKQDQPDSWESNYLVDSLNSESVVVTVPSVTVASLSSHTT
jgi:hypothetical protein